MILDSGSLFTIVATLLGSGGASGVRAVQPLLLVALLARLGLAKVPQSMSFLTSTAGLGTLLALLVIEEILERDDDLQELLAAFKYGVHGTGAAVTSYLLIDKFDLPLQGWPIVAISVVLSLLTHGLRMRVHDALRDIEAGLLSPREWLSWLESGGVLGLLVAVFIAPWLVLVLVAMMAVAGGVIVLVSRAIDQSMRRPCPTCGRFVRKEAQLCPYCKEKLEPVKWLGKGTLDRLEFGGTKALTSLIRRKS